MKSRIAGCLGTNIYKHVHLELSVQFAGKCVFLEQFANSFGEDLTRMYNWVNGGVPWKTVRGAGVFDNWVASKKTNESSRGR
jgi:hypothetical protein